LLRPVGLPVAAIRLRGSSRWRVSLCAPVAADNEKSASWSWTLTRSGCPSQHPPRQLDASAARAAKRAWTKARGFCCRCWTAKSAVLFQHTGCGGTRKRPERPWRYSVTAGRRLQCFVASLAVCPLAVPAVDVLPAGRSWTVLRIQHHSPLCPELARGTRGGWAGCWWAGCWLAVVAPAGDQWHSVRQSVPCRGSVGRHCGGTLAATRRVHGRCCGGWASL